MTYNMRCYRRPPEPCPTKRQLDQDHSPSSSLISAVVLVELAWGRVPGVELVSQVQLGGCGVVEEKIIENRKCLFQ